ncbi:hypothetical protein GIB67_002808 [Kingdonia uniflora]|uniref:Small nuclear ribonucleoprotein G n=1 Tax=Kingdonia uniflora TaxID=39325 RepID=A0A7J7M590_9MAGN|nr:hypothetical protein GIB67_002808 [Kingdonia uniflora]
MTSASKPKFSQAVDLLSTLWWLRLSRSRLHSSLARMHSFKRFKLNANRVVVGTLHRFDQFMNLVIDNTVETNGNEKNEIGMVVIRGNSVVMIEALEPVQRAQ